MSPHTTSTLCCCVKGCMLCTVITFLVVGYLAIGIYSKISMITEVVGGSELAVDSELGARVVGWMKEGRLSGLIKETSDRLIQIQTGGGTVTTTIIDVSHSREAGTIIRRIAERNASWEADLGFKRLVVDIGANDGFLSSNSFNLAQLGWSTVLVEPNPSQMSLAKSNQEPYIDVYGLGAQKSCYIEAAASPEDKDGVAELFLTEDASSMESHLMATQTEGQRARARSIRGGKAFEKGRRTLTVETVSVETISKRCGVPKRFGVLSIDAEGVGDNVLVSWITAGYRPEYVVYEPMHNKRGNNVGKELIKAGYRLMGKFGWNLIYEYEEKDKEREGKGEEK